MTTRPLLAAAALAAVTASASADAVTSQWGASFREVLASFDPSSRPCWRATEPPRRTPTTAPGVRIEVVRSLAELGLGSRIIAVRVYGNGTSVDGYTPSNDVDDATPLGR